MKSFSGNENCHANVVIYKLKINAIYHISDNHFNMKLMDFVYVQVRNISILSGRGSSPETERI